MAYLAGAVAHNELIAYPIVDARSYVDWADEILNGQFPWLEPRYYTPIIPLWIAFWSLIADGTPLFHFACFHVIGAAQAIILGKTAELLWGRRSGLAAAALAACYWPLIIFEATYYAEAFAIWNLSLGLYLLVYWAKREATVGWLAWAATHLALSILARANAIAILPLVLGWVLWRTWRAHAVGGHRFERIRRVIVAGCGVCIPVALLLAPVLWWNMQLTGRAMLRSGGWISIYVGNEPSYRGVVAPVGVRWRELVNTSLRDGLKNEGEADRYWREKTVRIPGAQPQEWMRLNLRKLLLMLGDTEVSQEIDIAKFREFSPALSLPVWPGWGVIACLSIFGALAMIRSREARAGLPLLLIAAAYFASALPVQACARYRLPCVVPLLPLAGWAVMALVRTCRQRNPKSVVMAGSIIGGAAVLVYPDWEGIRNEKLVSHSLFVGLKCQGSSDIKGAEAAFTRGMEWNPADPDCPLGLGRIALATGKLEKAQEYFQEALRRFPQADEALTGMGRCAFKRGDYPETLALAQKALAISPGDTAALDLLSRVHAARGDWLAVVDVCRQMRAFLSHAPSVEFNEVRALSHLNRDAEALPLLDSVLSLPDAGESDRQQATFLASILAWRLGDSDGFLRRCKALRSFGGYFGWLADTMLDPSPGSPDVPEMAPDPAMGPSAGTLRAASYARAIAEWRSERKSEAVSALREVLAVSNPDPARRIDLHLLDLWALRDLEKLGETMQKSPTQAPGGL